jgi:pyruvate formate lyase activating enzyme
VVSCLICGVKSASRVIGMCPDCLRSLPEDEVSLSVHEASRKKLNLPERPPSNPAGARCQLCANECRPGSDERGYCGLRKNEAGRIKPVTAKNAGLLHIYLDPLPTNCCAAWFCEGSKERGYNLAVFFYGCSFDCLFCQNHSHKRLEEAPVFTEEKVVAAALHPEVRCICFFGGSPEPQFPFALRLGQKILERSDGKKHICWEWNGSGHPNLVKKAAQLSARSGGTVKFDLKAYHPNISLALCGVRNRRAFENFSLLAGLYPQKDILTATTLLVPDYIDRQEIGQIARFISRLDNEIPYSLLVFHPDYLMTDLPVTSHRQVDECFEEASHHLSRVNVGNLHLL